MIPDLSFLHTTPFYELTAILTLASIVGCIGLIFRQPMIVGYIAVGILAGPSIFGIVKSYESIDKLADLSIAVLLFLVGIKLDLKQIKTLGAVSLTTGLGQIFFTSLIGFFIIIALGFDVVSSLYVAVALTFSSTIIIVKLLSDKKEVDALHGRIAIGFLIVQDFFAVLVMVLLSFFAGSLKGNFELSITFNILQIIFYAIVVTILLALFIKYLATPVMSRIVHSRELMITVAISWASLLAAIGSYFGFSKELGGLLAGISLASTPFQKIIVSKMSSLRDFLLLFFFISLGSHLELSLLGIQAFPAIVLSVFVLVGNPLIVMMIMGYMGYRKRTGLLAGLTVAQISEFSLLLMSMGLTFGHVSRESFGLVTMVGLITIGTSIYMITYSHKIYNWLEPFLGFLERKVPHREEALEQSQISTHHYDVILFGLGRYGTAIGTHLVDKKFKILGIDYNPDAVRRWQNLGFDYVFGDASDHELISSLPLKEVKWVISALPQQEIGLEFGDLNLELIEGLKEEKYEGKIAIPTQYPEQVESLQEKGVDLVILPFYDAAEHAVEKIRMFEVNKKTT